MSEQDSRPAVLGEAQTAIEPADEVSAEQSAEGEAAAEAGKRKRELITWNLGSKIGSGEASGAVEEEAEQAPGSPKRLRPNPAFLTGLVSGIKRTNQRIVAETTANAACQEITAAAANGAKIQFDRIPQQEAEKFRRLAVSVAQQQNLANCIALLKEVAAHYGFALTIEDDFAVTALPPASANGAATPPAVSPPAVSMRSMPNDAAAGEVSQEEGSDDGAAQIRPLKPMTVRLAAERADEPFSHRKRPAPPPEEPRPKPSLPALALNNRLAGAALSALTGATARPKLPPPKTLAMDKSPATGLARPATATAAVVSASQGLPESENFVEEEEQDDRQSDLDRQLEKDISGEELSVEGEEFAGQTLSKYDSRLNGQGHDRMQQAALPDPQLSGFHSDRIRRSFRSASNRLQSQPGSLEQRLGSAGEPESAGNTEQWMGQDKGEEPVEQAGASDFGNRVSALSRLASQPKAAKKPRGGLFGAAMSSLAR